MRKVNGFTFTKDGIATLDGKYVVLGESCDTDENALESFIGQYMRENGLLSYDASFSCDASTYLYQDESHKEYLEEITEKLVAIGDGNVDLVEDIQIGNVTTHCVFTEHLVLVDID